MNDFDQYRQRQNFEIQGILMSDNENNTEVDSKVLTVPKTTDKNYRRRCHCSQTE